MLVLSRQRDETIIIGDDIEVTVVDIRGDKVRLGINAPKDISVHRKEVYNAIHRENRASTTRAPIPGPMVGNGPTGRLASVGDASPSRPVLALPAIDKSDRDGHWRPGSLIAVDPDDVVAVEPRVHRWNSFRSDQDYAVVRLSSGTELEVLATARSIEQKVAARRVAAPAVAEGGAA